MNSKRAPANASRRLFKLFLGLCLTAGLLIGLASVLGESPLSEKLAGLFTGGDTANSIPARRNTNPPATRPTHGQEKISGPVVAVIIDDIGYDLELADKLLTIDGDLTFSVLPYLPYSQHMAESVKEAGRELMLHMPMEPRDSRKDPGPGALLTSMDYQQLRTALNGNLDAVPGVVGVNNHMGSRFTADEKRMAIVLEGIKASRLFFVDSRTTQRSVAYRLALEMGIRTYASDLFLDSRNTERFVKKQWDRLIEIARDQGRALGICHPREVTYAVLEREIPLLENSGVTLVPASRVVK